ncbi:hypothetical protein SAMN05443287_105334 [Micromonospora phaseoli]|uniref:Uncharacterized protein n=1 Tax=Micromonospora phaseoli TaxID=1144548 RepID=A0A1H7A075_9ACTN|nr:hypothetical protein [Micromonospora phaseoli]PZV96972.1 hypothetical protein CLV64_10679 [Micromonospora phaseoli]GIJ77948.1 hypothetical protein Xph01_23800 [Micromonospora phaseoli]SEJ57834.1 hypothetical protein SAMN05443287_105334 [Micromonospora phaseoli]
MTSPAEPPPTDPTPARQVTGPLRELVAIVLLGANAVFLFVGLIRLLTPQGAYSTVTGRAASSFFAFIGVEAVVLPVLAVLLATHLAPVVPRAKLITQVALGEYVASAVLGGLTLLIWVVGRLAEGQVFDAMTGMLTRAAWVALFAAAGYVVWSVWQRLYHVPRPKPEPGVYGTPQPGWPQPGGPGQSGYQSGGWSPPAQPGGWPGGDQSAGYPGAGHPGHPGGGQPAGYYPTGSRPGDYATGGYPTVGQPGSESGGQPGRPTAGQVPSAGGPPESPHTWPPHGQPAVPPAAPSAPAGPPPGQPAAAPSSPPAGPPFGQPAGPPFGQPAAPPFGQPAAADPTQSIPRQGAERPADGDADRTQRIDPGDSPR